MIRALTEDDVAEYVALRQESLRHAPLAFSASPEDDFATAVRLRAELRRGPEWVIYGAFRPQLAGFVGLMRDRHLKASHKAHIWGMYVAPDHRRAGVAAALLDAAIGHARSLSGVTWVHLSVNSSAPEARRLYERAGFVHWGSEPDALIYNGQATLEHHMALRLH
jgi:ribosomal protein S18 acetylase RimI-like enzyme